MDGSMNMTSFIDFYMFHLLHTLLNMNTFAKSHGTLEKKIVANLTVKYTLRIYFKFLMLLLKQCSIRYSFKALMYCISLYASVGLFFSYI